MKSKIYKQGKIKKKKSCADFGKSFNWARKLRAVHQGHTILFKIVLNHGHRNLNDIRLID